MFKVNNKNIKMTSMTMGERKRKNVKNYRPVSLTSTLAKYSND